MSNLNDFLPVKGTKWIATPKTANFTAVAGEGYYVDTSSNAITVTMPASPSVGDEVTLIDYAGNFNSNKASIDGAGSDKIRATRSFSMTRINFCVFLE